MTNMYSTIHRETYSKISDVNKTEKKKKLKFFFFGIHIYVWCGRMKRLALNKILAQDKHYFMLTYTYVVYVPRILYPYTIITHPLKVQ